VEAEWGQSGGGLRPSALPVPGYLPSRMSLRMLRSMVPFKYILSLSRLSRTRDLPVLRWPLPLCPHFIRPEPVTMKRLAAAFFVFRALGGLGFLNEDKPLPNTEVGAETARKLLLLLLLLLLLPPPTAVWTRDR